MAAEWTFMLCDGAGAALADITAAAGKNIAFKRNSYHEAQCTLSMEDTAAKSLFTAMATGGMPQLRGYRRGDSDTAGVQRFKGTLVPFTDQADENAGTVQLVFRSGFAALMQRWMVPPFAGRTYSALEQTVLAQTLVTNTNFGQQSACQGATIVPTAVNRTISYDVGANVGQSILDLAALLDGFEFLDTPYDDFAHGNVTSQLSLAATVGQDRPAARFEYGRTTLANIRNVSRTITPPITVADVVGANGLIGHAVGATAQYGVLQAYESRPDVNLQFLLDARAQQLLRPYPTRLIEFTPDPVLAPRPFDDYGLGDTVRLFARHGSLMENTPVRVNAFTITIDENGREAYAIPDPQTPEEEAEIYSALFVEVLAALGTT